MAPNFKFLSNTQPLRINIKTYQLATFSFLFQCNTKSYAQAFKIKCVDKII